MLIGYMLLYHDDTNCELPSKILTNYNCHKLISEAHVSAKQRNKLENLLNCLREGDKIIISKLHAIADSTQHLVELLNRIEASGASVQSLQEEIDTHDTDGYSFTHIVKHLAVFQRDV